MVDGDTQVEISKKAPLILTVNGGSSSIKFALFTFADPPTRQFSGQIERIGQPGTQLVVTAQASSKSDIRPIDAANYQHAADHLIQYLRERFDTSTIIGIGHRVVHGGMHLIENQLVTPKLLDELRHIQSLDLTHLPREIALIEAFGKSFPARPQIVCFDTAFHRDMPPVARMLPIPRHYHNEGIQRFGFHGLSYTYLLRQLAAVADPQAAHGRVILAHLGAGASMAAVRGGKPIDTTMAFTPTAGLMMGTRPGDMDPGLLVYLMRLEKFTPDQIDDFISRRCGLLGVSETSADMRDLLRRRDADPRAADAVDLFCYQAKKFLGGLTAAMGGLDTLVFAGGIGEHAPEVRATICENLTYLGLHLDPARNAANEAVISSDHSDVVIRIIATDEELVIAQAARSFLQSPQ